MTFRPTPEQTHAMHLFKRGLSFKIEACAGSGKTSTLKFLARSTRQECTYIAFNKSIAQEASASFPGHVTCKTSHALAFPRFAASKTHRLGRRIFPEEVVKVLGLCDDPEGDGPCATRVASVLLGAMTLFCQSHDATPGPEHVPHDTLHQMEPDDAQRLLRQLAPLYVRLWHHLIDDDSSLGLDHSVYLKQWALSMPPPPSGIIFMDEAQDTNAMMLGVLRHWMTQGAQVVFVGDPYQEIYAWRGAISAMTRLDDIPTARLTQSFRYGPHIAQVANAILTYQRDVPSCIRGYHTIRDCVLESSPSQSNAMSQDQVTGELTHRPEGDPADAPQMEEEEVTWDALLCRTNARVIEELMRHIHTRKCGVAGGVRQLLALIHDVASLQRGERATRSQELRDFESWEQLEEHARSEVGGDLMGLVRLVQSHDIHELIDLLEEVERTPDCEVELMISTAHKSKGLEWPRVKLASDFPAPRENGQKNPRWSHEEAHLLYVASTRACKVLDIRGCLAATQAMEALREDPSRIEEDLAPYDEVDEPDVPLPDGELATWLGKPSTSSTSSPVSSRTSEMFRPLGTPHSLLQTTQPQLASGYLTHGTFLKSEAFARLETLASAQGLDLESMLEELLDAHEESMALRMGKRWTQTSLF